MPRRTPLSTQRSTRTSSIAFVTALLASAAIGCGDDTATGGSVADGGSPPTGGSGGAGGEDVGGMGGTGGTGGVGGSGYEEIDCSVTLEAPALGICGVATSGTTGLLLRGTVLGPGALYRGGGVLLDDAGIIQCVGCDCETAPGGSDASVVDCPDGVISPGLINPHDHITYANNAPHDVGTTRYDHRHEWRTGANGMPEINVNSGASTEVVLFAELRFLMSGATSTAGAGGRAGLLRNLDTSNLEGLPTQVVNSDTFPLADQSGTLNTSGCDYGASPTTEDDIDGLRGYLPHIAEGIGPDAQNEFACTSDSAVQDGHDLIEPQTAVIHAIGMNAADFQLMQSQLSTVIWSPRSNVALYGDTARVTMIDALGVPIALGTDWMPSGSMNLLRELHCADELNSQRFGQHFSDLALWRMVTENAAFATGTSDAIGMLKVGYTADIAIFDASVRSDFRAVIGGGVEDVVLVLRGGEALYGDAALLDDPAIGGAACEDLPVCGVDKKACVAQDVGGGTTLAAIQAAGTAIYPLFFCNDMTPMTEPSCVPWREEYPEGITATDADGDGEADATDLCPNIFDPVRPLDGSTQADADADGIGDACDACPLVSGESCSAPAADDVDGDGVINAVDVCPDSADADQADSDMDGHGDVCDACPDAPNPGPGACALSIATLRDPSAPGHPAVGTSVAVTGWVTAIKASPNGGFALQDSADPFSGIFVFTGQTPVVLPGNEVTVSGVYEEFFELSEITSPSITVVDAGTTLPFAAIVVPNSGTLSTAATAEPLESMLVTVQNVVITTQNPDGASDFDEFGVSSAASAELRIDDQFFIGLDNTCALGSVFTSITGVHGFSFSNFKLAPRNAADVVFTTCQPYL